MWIQSPAAFEPMTRLAPSSSIQHGQARWPANAPGISLPNGATAYRGDWILPGTRVRIRERQPSLQQDRRPVKCSSGSNPALRVPNCLPTQMILWSR